jgi:hypothetical protein
MGMFRQLTSVARYLCFGMTTMPPVHCGRCKAAGDLYAQNNSTSDFLNAFKSRMT